MPAMTQPAQSGPGMVSLELFLAGRLDEDTVSTAHEEAEADVKRQVLDAHHRSKPFTVHRAGIDIALRTIAGIWAEHPDYDPSWRR